MNVPFNNDGFESVCVYFAVFTALSEISLRGTFINLIFNKI